MTVDPGGERFTTNLGGTGFLTPFVAAVAVLVVAHAGNQGLVYRLRGYDVSYGVAPKLEGFYAAAFRQFQSREEQDDPSLPSGPSRYRAGNERRYAPPALERGGTTRESEVTREDNLVAAIAPLVVIDAALLVSLFVPVPIVAVTGFLGLAFNAGGAAGDLTLVAKLLRMPEETLLYDTDISPHGRVLSRRANPIRRL